MATSTCCRPPPGTPARVLRTARDRQRTRPRSVFLSADQESFKATITYPMSTGRNFDEILRLVDSCQLTASKKVATPVNWKQGEDVIILPAVSDEAARAAYPDRSAAALRPYIFDRAAAEFRTDLLDGCQRICWNLGGEQSCRREKDDGWLFARGLAAVAVALIGVGATLNRTEAMQWANLPGLGGPDR
ncbi:Peroxiredoxin-6 [Geodia barretti]|uniref:Peroxiredoxin-6 n=1 Tax=Geodia barretti TaxID=519541 RepID=A0AA35SUP3_GEOBA|nr:Peroxiredoxin-6 [Geodia barretti]